jgi:chromosome segregation ATPase
MADSLAVLKEKVRRVEVDLVEMKGDIKVQGEEIEDLAKSKETTLVKLEQIQKQLDSIQTAVSKDSGWRGFLFEFIKAAAQIGALIGAGKWIF